MDEFQSYFGSLYLVNIFNLFYKLGSCWDKTRCYVRWMKRYVTLDVWDSLYVDYVGSHFWKFSYERVNTSVFGIIYGRTHTFVWYQIYGIYEYMSQYDLRCMEDLMHKDTWYQFDGKAFSWKCVILDVRKGTNVNFSKWLNFNLMKCRDVEYFSYL
jgi:hypothetical protein